MQDAPKMWSHDGIFSAWWLFMGVVSAHGSAQIGQTWGEASLEEEVMCEEVYRAVLLKVSRVL